MVDDPDDATGPSHSQKGMTGATVVGPCTSVEVFVSLQGALGQGNNWPKHCHCSKIYNGTYFLFVTESQKRPKVLKEEQYYRKTLDQIIFLILSKICVGQIETRSENYFGCKVSKVQNSNI